MIARMHRLFPITPLLGNRLDLAGLTGAVMLAAAVALTARYCARS
jgi:hypothetical protein